MELREYLKIVLRSWWVIIPIVMGALSLSLLFSYTRTPVFESQSTHIIAFTDSSGLVDQADRYYILDLLVGRQQLAVNFCQTIISDNNYFDALRALNIDESMWEPVLDASGNEIAKPQLDLGKYDISCNVLPESSVLLLIVRGTSPQLVKELNNGLAVVGRGKVESIYNNMLTIEVLTSPSVDEGEPISPNHTQNAALGLGLGVVVGLTAALMMDYFRSPLEKMGDASIRDPFTNAYNERYFTKRLAEEVERSHQRNRPISVGLLELKPNEDYSLMPQVMREEFLHQASLYIQDKLQQGDIVAYRGNMQFIVLLPETPGYEARGRLMVVYSALRSHLFRTELYATSFSCKVGIVESGGEALQRVDLLQQAQIALHRAEENSTRHVYLMSTQSSAFVLDDETESELQLDQVLPEDELIDRVTSGESDKRQQRGLARLFGGGSSSGDSPLSGDQHQGRGAKGAKKKEDSPFNGGAGTSTADTSSSPTEDTLNLQQTLPADDPLLGDSELPPYTPSTTAPDKPDGKRKPNGSATIRQPGDDKKASKPASKKRSSGALFSASSRSRTKSTPDNGTSSTDEEADQKSSASSSESGTPRKRDKRGDDQS